MPCRISIVSARLGSSTNTGWKRRSSAASFSMYLRYSFRVVAPMHWISPRARAGLRMVAASIAPSAAPAPTSVCSSSMHSTTPRRCRTRLRLLARFPWAGRVQQPLGLAAHLRQVGAVTLEHMGGAAFALDQQPEQEVLSADVVVGHGTCLFEGDLDDLLAPRRRN